MHRHDHNRSLVHFKYAQPSLITHTDCTVCGILTSNVVIGKSRNGWQDNIVITEGDFHSFEGQYECYIDTNLQPHISAPPHGAGDN